MLLDEKYGFAPHNTWSNITNENALKLIGDYDGKVIKLGLTRSYACRHGAGPLVTEQLDTEGKLAGEHNVFNEWQQDFRFGNLDLVTLRYSINNLKGIDYLVVNHCDKIKENNSVCTEYSNISDWFYRNGNLVFNEQQKQQFDLTKSLSLTNPVYKEVPGGYLINFISNNLNVKIGILGAGQTHNEREYLLDI